MASTNETVASLLREYSELVVITGGDQFRARNYEKAAKAVEGARTRPEAGAPARFL